MMKKNVIIRSGSLRMGGLERVLIEVLQNINREKYNLILVIDDDCGEDNIFEKDIPKEIKYYFLKSQKLIERTNYYKSRRKNLLYKLMYNIYMNIETYIKSKNLEKLIDKLGNIDVFIDYDAGSTKYIENIKADKKVVWIHNSIPNLKKSESKINRFGKRLEKYDKIIAICDEMKEELKETYPNLKDRIIRIYNPFNFSRVLDLKDDTKELSEKDKKILKEDYCIAISRLDTVQKDYKTLLEAFQILKSKGIRKKIYIVGDGPSKKEIEDMIKEYNLSEEVKLLGRFKNPYIWLNNADFFIHSSKYEGFGLVLVEAAILNKLVISSNCPVGPTEILENGKSGILFNVGDSKELAEKIEEVLNNKSLRNKYILNMKFRKEAFKKENILKEYEKLIDEI